LAVFAFAATCVCVFIVNLPRWGAGHLLSADSLWKSLVFTSVLMSILLTHELGHLWMARFHRLRLSVPWFVPFPWLVGTMGAVIVPLETPRDRSSLTEMAAAGPLAGAAVVVVALAIHGSSDVAVTQSSVDLGVPLVWYAVDFVTQGSLGAPSTADPVGFACWIGCLVTALNLLPFGQLDGGHLFSSLFPRYARRATWIVTIGLLLMGIVWGGWLLWCVALHLFGSRESMDVRNDASTPSVRARGLAWACLIVFILFGMPVPIS
jgi:membrane-associated protease RseP (regulator of RpoE activity)